MRYHLKEDGTAAVCRAQPGNCPKGDAIHGDSVEEVYSKLETVMSEQLLPEAIERVTAGPYPEPEPRAVARVIGWRGSMLHYTDPEIVRRQLDALQKLGLVEEALPTLEYHQPVLAGALKAGRLDAVNFNALYEKPHEYVYEAEDGANGVQSFTSENYTWVARTYYELQTVALNSYMDSLETGTLVGADLAAYRTALGDTDTPDGRGVQSASYLAFNYNPHRQKEGFFNRVKNRFLAEGFDATQVSPGVIQVRMPDFFWQGLDQEAKERVATHLLHANYPTYQDRGLVENVLGGPGGYRSSPEFGDLLEKAVTHHRDLHGRVYAEGEEATFDLGDFDPSYPVVKASYKLAEDGVFLQEHKRLFYSKEDRRKGLHREV